MGDGVPYPFYLIYLLSSVGAKPDSPTSAHRAEKSMYRNAHTTLNTSVVGIFPAMPEISNMHFTYSLCAVKRRPREEHPLNAHFVIHAK